MIIVRWKSDKPDGQYQVYRNGKWGDIPSQELFQAQTRGELISWSPTDQFMVTLHAPELRGRFYDPA